MKETTMDVEVNAVYEGGVLKLEQPLPLPEQARVRIVVKVSRAEQAYGLLGWTGDPEVLRQVALDPEFDPEEAP
jgi:predicted DNA-binding antitoxin AbrB/MazE fold protein